MRTQKQALGILAALIVLGGILPGSAEAGLTDTESDGYLQWLHSLEQAVTARTKSGLEEGNLLYPFDAPGWRESEIQPYRHLSISKAIGELEREWLLRGEERTESPLVALANARNYVNLSEYDSALVWFGKAEELDREGNFRREIRWETLATAAAERDSLAMLQCITNSIGNSVVTGHESEFILALRWILVQQDSETLDLVLQKIDADGPNLTDRLRFWVAYSLSWRRDRDRALEHLRVLVQSGGLSRDLSESQRGWVLAAIPDLLFLAGDQAGARNLYEVAANSSLPRLSSWSAYQVANLDLLDGRYLRASEGFKRVCEGKRQGTWQDQACEMTTIATEIERLKSEGEPYGAGAFYNP